MNAFLQSKDNIWVKISIIWIFFINTKSQSALETRQRRQWLWCHKNDVLVAIIAVAAVAAAAAADDDDDDDDDDNGDNDDEGGDEKKIRT